MDEERRKIWADLIKNVVYRMNIDRSSVVSMTINAYSSNTNLHEKELKVTFKHERGIDVDGLRCEVVNCFWDNFETTFMNGNTEKVPQVLPTSLSNFYHIGRFISHAYVLTGYFPVNLSIVFSKIMVCSEETYIYDDQLLSSTLHFVDNFEEAALYRFFSSQILPNDLIKSVIIPMLKGFGYLPFLQEIIFQICCPRLEGMLLQRNLSMHFVK